MPGSLYLIRPADTLTFCHHINIGWIALHFSLPSNLFLSFKNCAYWGMQQLDLTLVHSLLFLALIVSKYHVSFSKRLRETLDLPKEVTFGLCTILVGACGLKLRGSCLRKGQEVWQKVFVLNICHLFLQIHSSFFSTLLYPGRWAAWTALTDILALKSATGLSQ